MSRQRSQSVPSGGVELELGGMSLALVAVVVVALCAISFWLGRQSVPAVPAGVLNSVPLQSALPVMDGGDVESELTFFDRLERAPDLSAQGDERTVKPAHPAPRKPQPAKSPGRSVPVVSAPEASQVQALPTATGGAFQIQVLATTEREAADAMVTRLKSRGFPAHLTPGTYKGQAVFRVRVGGYPDEAAAQQVARAIQDREGLQTWVTH